MKLGGVVNELIYPHWQFVEGDLHGVAERVQEYDAEAKLARDMISGQLGLARKIANPDPHGLGHTWVIAKRLQDSDGTPLEGEPDARVVEQQKASDAWRVGNLKAWRTSQEQMWRLNEIARVEREIEKNMGIAEEMVWTARRKDLHHEAPVSVPADIPKSDG
jgi:hypothetical protein